jgi:PAT family beta-lactamase induction signal transducer AmpG
MAVLFLLGFSGGLPLLLTGQTLQAWMTDARVDLGRIADLSAVGLAYTLKFAWAPLLDRYRLPFLGRRRGWLIAFQVALMAAIAVMGAIDPVTQPLALAGVAIAVAFLSASQDVMIDAYKADILAPPERAAGSAMYVLGYRVAMLVAGTVALVMADHIPWRITYGVMAALMVIGMVGVWLADEPSGAHDAPKTLADSLALPFIELYRRLRWQGLALVVLFAASYRFGDYFAQTLTVPFLKTGMGFSNTDVALVNKALGFVGTAIGGLFAGSLVARFGLRRMLVAFGVMAAVTNLLYAWLAVAGKDYAIFCMAVGVDHVATALGTAAFLSVLMAVCSPAVSATQFALLTSLSSVGQRVFGPLADDVYQAVGWAGFFIATALMAIPGLLLAWRVSHDVKGDV